MRKDNKGPGLSMDEIDRKIEEMPVFDLRDPRARKNTGVDINEIVASLNLEQLLQSRTGDDVKNIDSNHPEKQD